MRTLLLVLILSITFSSAFALPDPGVAVTIYNDNFAVVKERREMGFEKGVNTVKFTDVASAIDPTSVNFKCLSAPDDISILEQNYEYDLVNTSSLLKRYIDKEVDVLIKGSGADGGTIKSGVLKASIGQDLILGSSKGGMDIISRDSIQHISLSKAPDDLVTKPTLVWLADSDKRGDQLCQVTYTTRSISWKADYSAVLNDTEDALDLTAWVTVDNNSGTAYKNATIKLIAGDVRTIQPQPVYRSNARASSMLMTEMAYDDGGFQEKEFMDYHMYTLGRKSTVNNNQVKQIELMPAAQGVKTEKLYVYEVTDMGGRRKSDKVQIRFEFKNEEENKLGIALPKGKVRVFKKDTADDTLEFVGEDEIDHTARKEKVSLYIGDAFDIVTEDKITDSRSATSFRRMTHEIEVRNRKNEPATVYIDNLCPERWNMDISNNNVEMERKDAYTVRFKVPVKADSTEKLTYTVTYTW